MSGVEAAAAIAIAAVLAVAAVAKWRDRSGTVSSFAQLHLPAPRAMAWLVPAAEVAVAALVLAVPAVAGWAAVALLAAFTAVLGRAVSSGLDVPCACFGAARQEAVSHVELVRNVLLIALAVVATGASSVTDVDLPGAFVVAGAITLGRVGLGLLHMHRDVGSVFRTTLPGEPR